MGVTAEHRQMLLDSAISAEVIDASGIQSTPKGLMFPWNDGVQPVVWQSRPDVPFFDENGDPVKYIFPKGATIPFNRLRETGSKALILAEGTKQSYAVLSHAPAHMDVYGMSGCYGFVNADMTVFEGRDVYLLADADIETNPGVWAAAEQLTKQAKRYGATGVHYVVTTGTGKEGVDDVLAKLPEAKRAPSLNRWLAAAGDKLPKRPKAKRPVQSDLDAEAAKLFRQRDKPLAFQSLDTAQLIMQQSPAAITAEKNIALYRDGVYVVDEDAILAVVTGMLGNFYQPSHLKTTTDQLRGLLKIEGRILPERMAAPWLNCPNTMVDLKSGRTFDHNPDYMSYVQITTDYRPDMPTPVYDAWLREALRQDGHTDADLDALVADIEETSGTMLDPSRTPSKALFLFGPSRSGKSTYLRLLKAIAGAANTSAVTLHELGTDQFATANLYGKMLNVAADLSNAHVTDLSKFKMATGEDLLNANRKYGQQFSFTNQALFAFSANELPTVSEASRAYAERMKPFSFPNSFAGREDKTLEDKLMAELPGILARWVKAYGRFLARGGYGVTDAATQTQFEAKSDRVVQFFQDMCTVTEAAHGARLDVTQATGRRDVAVAFNAWAERNGGSKMGERAFFQRFAQIAGINEVRIGSGSRGFNVTVARADDDVWAGEDAEPVADPVAPSGVAMAANPWAASEGPTTVPLAPVFAEPEAGPQTGADGFELTASADPFGDGLNLNYDF